MTGAIGLRSHHEPPRRLKQHIAEVWAAARALIEQHDPRIQQARPATLRILETMVRGHDLGKGSPAFQRYIKDPRRFFGDRLEKAHAPLGALLCLHLARSGGWPALETLALVAAVAGHHSGFLSLEEIGYRLIRVEDHEGLARQWENLPTTELSNASTLEIPDTLPTPRQIRRSLFRGVGVGGDLAALDTAARLGYRLWVQFMFSILLEADKAFLAVERGRIRDFLFRRPVPFEPDWIAGSGPAITKVRSIDAKRTSTAKQVMDRWGAIVESEPDARIFLLTLPTGLGKTLVGARWALEERKRRKGTAPPRVIVALPFLSITEQTQKVYRELLEQGSSQGPIVLESHSLADRTYELEDGCVDGSTSEFFIDTWKSEVVITTFDQILHAIFDPAPRHLMRFHALCDAIIILDEVQVLPCRLWDPIRRVLEALVKETETRVLMMTATQPGFMSGALDLAGTQPAIRSRYRKFDRYRFILSHRGVQHIDAFLSGLIEATAHWIRGGQRVLVTFNTRGSARTALEALAPCMMGSPIHFLTADVTPRDRLESISRIRSLERGEPCIVVTTQCIEAGVDIDMTHVIRDFAPLDSLVQVAGRCNRHGQNPSCDVLIVSLTDDRGRRFADMIYDPVLLASTEEALAEITSLPERDVFDVMNRYHDFILQRKDSGVDLTESYSRWEPWSESVGTILRGERLRSHEFLIIDETDTEGEEIMGRFHEALNLEDRWERRRELRSLAGPIQQRTVSVHAGPAFHPEVCAKRMGNRWLLKPGWYSKEAGLDLRPLKEVSHTCVF